MGILVYTLFEIQPRGVGILNFLDSIPDPDPGLESDPLLDPVPIKVYRFQ